MSRRPRVGLLGGTFDPVHMGHLAAARAAQAAVALDSVRFIPSARPPHRPDSPRASEYHRMEMLRRALAGVRSAGERTDWEVSDLELRRDGPSYSYETISAFHRAGLNPLQIFFIIGADAFAEIATWHRYPEVLDTAHFAVVARPGTTIEGLRRGLPALSARMTDAAHLANSETTSIVLIDSGTPSVSSTEIRRRAAQGESLDGLVPPAVAAYIAQHSLYRAPITTGPAAPGPLTPNSGR